MTPNYLIPHAKLSLFFLDNNTQKEWATLIIKNNIYLLV